MNPSTALARVIVSALAELGVEHVVLCPGSRSAPLAYALADVVADAGERFPIELHVRLDERSAGFLALGLAKGSGRPVAIVTTSGTAVANLHPAVLEASHGGVPLLVLSADRPHELRGTGANQTTDQVRMFGTALRWFGEIPAPARRRGQVAGWRNIVARAVAAASGTPGAHPGPVQLNLAFAEPLVPDDEPDGDQLSGTGRRADRSDAGSVGSAGSAGSAGSVGSVGSVGSAGPWPEPLDGVAGLTVVMPALTPPPTLLTAGPRTVVVAGDGAGPDAAHVAARAAWPLLAEPSSGARLEGAIPPYRLLLARPDFGGRIERVVVFGRPTLSRPVTRLLSRDDVELVVVSGRPDWVDPGRRAAVVLPAVRGPVPDEATRAWLARWQAAGAVAATAIGAVLDGEAAAGRLTGPLVAREVAAATEGSDVLVTGSSNPVRDLDLAADPFAPTVTVLANRGLAGIDGLISTASGVALARSPAGAQVRLLVGDLTFLHDAGGLLTGMLERRPDLQIVLLDDAGGGIFGLLEQGAVARRNPRQQAVFERVFGTPQHADLPALCAGYDVAHQFVDDVDALRKALAEPPPGLSVVQVRVDRAGQSELAARLARAVDDALPTQASAPLTP